MADDRRRFLTRASLVVIGAGGLRVLEACKPGEQTARDAAMPPPLPDSGVGADKTERALTPAQRRTIECLCARLLPSDEDPGATEANVAEYIDRTLAQPRSANVLKRTQGGVIALERMATRSGGKGFAALPPAEQDEIIGQLQHGSPRGRQFVQEMVILTLEGFFGDPMYGGNAHGLGWKLSGYGPGTHQHGGS